MENIENIKIDLRNALSEKRYLHSIGTMKSAQELAKYYGLNAEKAGLAGLLHDIAKEMPDQEKIQYVKEHNIEMDRFEEKNIGLLHAKIAANIAKEKYHFDKDIQQAIEYHTTGNPNMNLFDKIIFVADKIEETRSYPDLNYVRELAHKNINECVIYIIEFAVKKTIERGEEPHSNSILTINKLKEEEENKKSL